MKRFRDPNWALIALFLAILAAVPLVQTALEAGQEDGIKALDLFSEFPTAANLRAYEQNLEKVSWAARTSRPWIQFVQFAWFKYGGEKAVLGARDWYFYKPGLKYMLDRPPAPNTTNDPVAAIIDFRDQLAARGVHLLLMPVPNKDSIYPDLLTSRQASPLGLVAPRTREILERLRAAQVEFVDLFTEFHQARQKQSAPLYLAQDTHWSPMGVDLAAHATARRLTELGWVQTGTIDYVDRPAPVQRLGDIVHMMQAAPIERGLPPEQVPAVQIVRHDNGQLYKDGADAQVLVLGDSFMRIYQQDAPTAAGFISHLAQALKQPMMSLVNDGGGSTLVREELAGRPIFLKGKKVVLWEFVERDIGLGLKGWPRTALTAALPKPVAAEIAGRSRSAAEEPYAYASRPLHIP